MCLTVWMHDMIEFVSLNMFFNVFYSFPSRFHNFFTFN